MNIIQTLPADGSILSEEARAQAIEQARHYNHVSILTFFGLA